MSFRVDDEVPEAIRVVNLVRACRGRNCLARSRSFLKDGGREGIRTPGLLIANGESLKLRRVATIS